MTSDFLRLGVNIDHVATVRNARGGRHPEPLRAAKIAIEAGADGITAHLREDRRHIGDADIEALTALCQTLGKPLNFEMAVTKEMTAIALRHRPHAACLVPERREERTTEGGLDVARGHNVIAPVVRQLAEAGIRVSLFIAPDPVQIAVAEAVGAHVVELHTGAWCEALHRGEEGSAELAALRSAAIAAAGRGLEVHMGHGLDFETAKIVAGLAEVKELNIGHFLIGEAIFIGLDEAVRRMRRVMDEGRAARADVG